MIISNKFNRLYKRVISEQEESEMNNNNIYGITHRIIEADQLVIKDFGEYLQQASNFELSPYMRFLPETSVGGFLGSSFQEFQLYIPASVVNLIFSKYCKNKDLINKFKTLQPKEFFAVTLTRNRSLLIAFKNASVINENGQLEFTIDDDRQLLISDKEIGNYINLGKPAKIRKYNRNDYEIILTQNQIEQIKMKINTICKKIENNLINRADEICYKIANMDTIEEFN